MDALGSIGLRAGPPASSLHGLAVRSPESLLARRGLDRTNYRLLGLETGGDGFGDVVLLGWWAAFIGWQSVLVVFFLAPLWSLGHGSGQLLIHGRREIPYGPYLSLATLVLIVGWKWIWPVTEGSHLFVGDPAAGGGGHDVRVAGGAAVRHPHDPATVRHGMGRRATTRRMECRGPVVVRRRRMHELDRAVGRPRNGAERSAAAAAFTPATGVNPPLGDGNSGPCTPFFGGGSSSHSCRTVAGSCGDVQQPRQRRAHHGRHHRQQDPNEKMRASVTGQIHFQPTMSPALPAQVGAVRNFTPAVDQECGQSHDQRTKRGRKNTTSTDASR